MDRWYRRGTRVIPGPTRSSDGQELCGDAATEAPATGREPDPAVCALHQPAIDEPLRLGGLEPVVDGGALARLVERHLVERVAGGIRLSPRGRLLGGAVTAELLSA